MQKMEYLIVNEWNHPEPFPETQTAECWHHVIPESGVSPFSAAVVTDPPGEAVLGHGGVGEPVPQPPGE